MVYLLPKDPPPEREGVQAQAPDRTGHAVFSGVDPRGCWICASATHHLLGFADGDAWSREEVSLVLEVGRLVQVDVRCDGGALPAESFVLATSGGTRRAEWPAPGENLYFWQTTKLDGQGTVGLRPPTRDAMQVGINAPGFYALEGDSATVPPDREQVTFTLLPVCRIRLEVTDAKTGQGIEYDAEVRVVDLATAREVCKQAASQFCAAADWKQKGLRPGEYSVEVTAPGYRPWPPTTVRLDEPGAEVAVRMPMRLDPVSGRLVLSLDLSDGSRVGEEMLYVQDRLLVPESQHDPSWTERPIRAVDRSEGTLSLWPLPVGDHELLVWAGSDRVGRVRVHVVGGGVDRARVRLGPGVLVDFASCPLDYGAQEVVEEGEPERGEYFVDVLDTDGIPLPEVRWRSRQRGSLVSSDQTRESAEDVADRGTITRDTVLGPFPCAEVWVRHALSDEPTWEVGRK